jgi:hypothetical protein
MSRPAIAPKQTTITGASMAARWKDQPNPALASATSPTVATAAPAMTGTRMRSGYPQAMSQVDYSSGEDYVVKFLGHELSFNGADFEQRVTAAAVKLGLVRDNALDEDETADLVELVSDGRIADPQSGLGRYLVRHWEHLSLLNGESLVYWLRKLVFRGAWLDHRVKEGLLEVSWDETSGDFAYQRPGGEQPLLELAPVPSWHDLQYED